MTAKIVEDPTAPNFAISTDKVCYVVVKAREFDVKDELADPDSGSNAIDDGMVDVLEDSPGDPVRQELVAFINMLNVDEQVDLVALAWLGRGDGSADGWKELRAEAADAHNARTAQYLLSMPLLADYLEAGLDVYGLSCDEFEADVL